MFHLRVRGGRNWTADLLIKNLSNLTQATIFRLVDKHAVTLLIDEVDVSFKRNEDLISLVNSGYMKKTANVYQYEGDKHEVKSFQY